MKKSSLAACVLVSATGTLGLGSAPANAAAASSNLYLHGTAKMASFTSYSTCSSYATATSKTITAHGGKIVGGSDAGRTKCFPLSNGHWSYLIAYTASTPVLKTDDTKVQAASRSTDSFWVFGHQVVRPASTFTQTMCEKDRSAFSRKVITNSKLRYIPSPACGVNSYQHTRGYLASYLGITKTSGFAGDHVTLWNNSVLVEASMLGYSIPGAM